MINNILEEKIRDIVSDFETYHEDHPHIVFTKDQVKDIVEEYTTESIDEITDAVYENICNSI